METSDKLLAAYENYYANPSIDTASCLYDQLISYTFSDYYWFIHAARRLFKSFQAKAVKSQDFVNLQTNGSSGKKRTYRWGPLFDFWVSKLEKHVKWVGGLDSVELQTRLKSSVKEHSFYPVSYSHERPPVKWCLSVNPSIFGSLKTVMSSLQSLPKQVNLFGDPINFLPLCSEMEFVDFLLSKEKVLSLVITQWEPFFKKKLLQSAGFHVNNNMIDWYNMVNFYTCPFNTLHFLPTFYLFNEMNICGNLLNLQKPEESELDDWMEFSPDPPQLCKCGRHYIKIDKFIPHYKYALKSPDGKIIHDPDLIENLNSVFYNLQFVQEGDTVNILFSPKAYIDINKYNAETRQSLRYNLHTDLMYLKRYFEENGLKTVFRPDVHMRIGGKILPFWNNLDKIPLSEWMVTNKTSLTKNNLKIATVLVAYATSPEYNWLRFCVRNFCSQLPEQTLLIVNHNRPKEEIEPLLSDKVICLNPHTGSELKHGSGIDTAVQWCKENQVDILVHIEPDCIINGREWFDELVRPFDNENVWMTGCNLYWHQEEMLHPCPSAWRVNHIQYSFETSPIEDDEKEDPTSPVKAKLYTKQDWDTGLKNWFFCHRNNHALKTPQTSDFHHAFHGGNRDLLALDPNMLYCGRFVTDYWRDLGFDINTQDFEKKVVDATLYALDITCEPV